MAGRIDGNQIKVLNAVVATGASNPVSPGNDRVTMQVTGITVATVQLQASIDGTNYVAVGTTTAGASGTAGLTADGCLTLDAAYKYVRANVTAWTSGTITVWLYY